MLLLQHHDIHSPKLPPEPCGGNSIRALLHCQLMSCRHSLLSQGLVPILKDTHLIQERGKVESLPLYSLDTYYIFKPRHA